MDKVYSVERIEPLLRLARHRLMRLGYRNVQYKLADGNWGWTDHAPYDGIIVTAAPADIPQTLIDQLAPGGRMVIPVGDIDVQELLLITHTEGSVSQTRLEHVNFVPLVQGRD